MSGPDFAPGVTEQLAAMAAGSDPAAPAAPTTAAPRFIGGKPRSEAIPLEWPVTYDGVDYHAIVLRRLTTEEVSAFIKKIGDQPADTKVTFPVFRTEEGDHEVPDVVLGILDDDDTVRLNEAAASFLPRRFRVAPDIDSPPGSGASTAP